MRSGSLLPFYWRGSLQPDSWPDTEEVMAANSEAEFRMMFLLNNMDINQEGQLSSEDRLFSSGTPRYQSEHAQVNKA